MNLAVSISQASGSKFKPNKHGVLPFILSPLNGIMPQGAGVIDGTLLQRMGLGEGQQAVLNITRAADYTAPDGKVYPNYQYTLVAKLGLGYENMVAQAVVASMNFGFTAAAPMTAPEVIAPPIPEVVDNGKK